MQDFLNMPGILGVGFMVFAVAVVMVFVLALYVMRRERASASEFTKVGNAVDHRSRIEQECQALKERKKALERDIAGMAEQSELSQKLAARLTEQEQELRSYDQAIEEARQAQSELALLASRRQQIESEEEELKKKLEEFQKIDAELKTKEKERDGLADECVQAKALKKEAELEYQTLMERIRDLEAKEKDAKDRKEEALREKERVENELNELHREIQHAEEARAELDQVRNEKARLERLRSELDAEKRAFETRKPELDALGRALAEKKAEFEKAKGACQGFYNEMAQYEVKARALEAEIERLTGSKTEIEKERAKAIEERDRAKKDLQNAGSDKAPGRTLDLSTLKKRPGDMEIRLPPWTAGATPDETDLLIDFGEALKKAGLVFSRRTIRSFHTSLKCQSISPLTVLAGVSGTGKTLLPLKYADFMGISKLVISVQPRWDSPQDLQGFPNYVERKFEARSLSQLLWSYQHDPEARFRNMLSLVLFDEMNLARTEYYFSDFLSKLELRHANEKSKGSMIDLGVGENFPVPLNMLMVGTMNEDESTQTLSDKVLDRANVLRFGRPAKMDVAHTTKHRMEASGKVVSAGVWNSWIESHLLHKSSDVEKKVSAWIDRLNSAMGEVGRPFGFRVREAMIEYVHQYPQYDGRDYYLAAFADQIEQKILPKLRGVDTSMTDRCGRCFQEIERLIGETGDKALLDAFRRDCKEAESRGLFVWTGVAREDERA